MQEHLRRADLILLLLSPTFFAVHTCYTAMICALQEKKQRQVPVVPIIARRCDWKASACSSLKALPDSALPLAEWTHPEQAYDQICAGLARLIPGLSISGQPVRPRLFQAPAWLCRGFLFKVKDQCPIIRSTSGAAWGNRTLPARPLARKPSTLSSICSSTNKATRQQRLPPLCAVQVALVRPPWPSLSVMILRSRRLFLSEI